MSPLTPTPGRPQHVPKGWVWSAEKGWHEGSERAEEFLDKVYALPDHDAYGEVSPM